MSLRQAVQVCPYCGESDLFPAEPKGWECRACASIFAVELLAFAPREVQR
jgi:ribosomal protein L37AE/L43A